MKKIDSTARYPTDPVKWKKHLTLVDWKLRDKKNLYDSINRYLIDDYMECLNDIRRELILSKEGYSFIIKFVYKESYLKLPNIVISSEDDFYCTVNAIKSMNLSKFIEIWYCKNRANQNNTVFGRMSFGNTPLFPTRCPIRFEMVWGNSARIIEQYPLINNTFVSYERESWNSKIEIAQLKKGNMHTDDILEVSERIIINASKYTPEIIDFASFVFSRGCNHLCLEFSFANNTFSFVDWDSDDDMKVLKI